MHAVQLDVAGGSIPEAIGLSMALLLFLCVLAVRSDVCVAWIVVEQHGVVPGPEWDSRREQKIKQGWIKVGEESVDPLAKLCVATLEVVGVDCLADE